MSLKQIYGKKHKNLRHSFKKPEDMLWFNFLLTSPRGTIWSRDHRAF